MTDSPSPLPRKRRKDARPGELTAAALALFVERGYAATRLDDVAARAGVSKGTLYLYFDSKESLFKAVIQEGIFPALDQAEALLVQHRGDAFALLQQLLETWWRCIGETAFSGIPKLIVAESGNFPELARFYYENVIRRGRALLGAALERGMASGEFRNMPVETCIDVVVAPLLMGLIWRHSLAHCLGGQTDPVAYVTVYLDLLRRGLTGPQV